MRIPCAGLMTVPFGVTLFGIYVGATLVLRWLRGKIFSAPAISVFRVSDIDRLLSKTNIDAKDRIALKSQWVKDGLMEENYHPDETSYRRMGDK